MTENTRSRFPISSVQKRTGMQTENSFHHFQRCVICIEGLLDEKRLIRSIEGVVAKHDILRTTYPVIDGFMFPMQEVSDDASFNLRFVDSREKNLTTEQIVSDYSLLERVNSEYDSRTHAPLNIHIVRIQESLYVMELLLPAIAADSCTVKNIVNEIIERYRVNAAEQGDSIQYFHFSEWSNGLHETPESDAIEFWKKYDYQKHLPYSFSLAQPAVTDSYSFASESVILNRAAVDTIKEIAGALKLKVEDVLFGYFAILVSRHVGKNTFTCGYVQAKRSYEELVSVAGPVSKALPVIVDVDPGTTFHACVDLLNKEKQKVITWEEYFQPDNDYFRSGFEYITMPLAANASGVRFTPIQITSLNERFDLKVNCCDLGDNIVLEFCYDSRLFPVDAIRILGSQFSTLTLNTLGDIEVGELPMIGKHEAEMLKVFSKTKTFSVPAETATGIFEKTATRFPTTVAVKDSNTAYTFDELNKRANQVAGYLKLHYKVGRGSVVAISMARSADLIVSILAVLKTGAAYVPIDSKFPQARVQYIIDDCAADVVITDTGKNFDQPGRTILFDTVNYQLFSSDDIKNEVIPSDPVYIIYTSGSTGLPKGVKISHESLVNYVTWFSISNNIRPGEKTMLLSSVAFDLCYTSLWTSLLTGGTLCVARETEFMDMDDINRILISDNIDYVKLTPSHFSIIINDPEFENNSRKYNLRLIVLGGEEIRPDDLDQYFQQRSDVKFLHHYGPTEATIGTIADPISFEDFPASRRKKVLGKPIFNNGIHVLDAQGRLCAIGVAGEICVSGKGVASGYLNRDELNREKFIDSAVAEGKLYRTGDLGRWLANRKIEYLGRKDHQLKIRGHRIEIGEIESVLNTHAQVTGAIILPVKDITGEIALHGYVESSERLNGTELRDFLAKVLPEYMIPAFFVVVSEFPLTPNGKVDRKALMETGGGEIGVSYMPPRTALEKKMARIWRDVLGKDKIGVTDDFFRFGGHSLKATQLVSRVFKNLGLKIKLNDVFAHPTIESLLGAIHESGQFQYAAIDRVPEAETYDVSHAQKRLWFLDQFGEKQNAYNMHQAYWLEGTLDIAAMEKAFRSTIERHESLRTIFQLVDGKPKQKIVPIGDFDFSVQYIDARKQKDPGAFARELSTQELEVIFSLENGPLLKALVVQLDEDSYSFLLTLHHIISDGWSMRVLFNEVLILYNSYRQGGNVDQQLAPLSIQYKDYANWHHKVITEKEAAYWDAKLSDPPPLVNLPYDNVLTDVNDNPYPSVELDVDTASALRELAKSHNCTLSNLMLTAYALMVNKISGQDDILIGIGHANRNHPDIESLIGFFVNLLVIRVQFSEDSSIDDIVNQVTQNCIEAYDHSNYPFDLLVERFCTDRYSIQQPLVNVLYDFKNYSDVLLENEGVIDESVLRISNMPAHRNISKFDLTLFVTEMDGKLQYYFEYNSNRFSESTIQRFYKIFNQLIAFMLSKNSIPA